MVGQAGVLAESPFDTSIHTNTVSQIGSLREDRPPRGRTAGREYHLPVTPSPEFCKFAQAARSDKENIMTCRTFLFLRVRRKNVIRFIIKRKLIISIGRLEATADADGDIGRSSQLDHSKELDLYFS